MTDTFDAVLAEMLETADVRDLRDGAVHTELVREWRDRLAAAHAAEKSAWFLRAREEAERCGQAESRAEAAERDARELLAESRKLALSHLGLLTIYGMTDGVEQTRAHISAIDAAIATTEQAPERAGRE